MVKEFTKRNHLPVHKHEATSIFRGTAFNKDSRKIFYNNLKKIDKKHSFTANEIYDADKTGLRNVDNPVKVVDEGVKKQVKDLVAAELGELVTLICAINI